MPASSVGATGGRAAIVLTVAAFAAVYLIWGSTYLGIAVAVTHLPALAMAGARFLVPGAVLLAWAVHRYGWPSRRAWMWGTVTGALMLGAGNGFLSLAEQRMPSGVAALVVATVPIWMAVLEWFPPHRRRPRPLVLAGLALGLTGVATLAWNPDGWRGGLDPRYVLLVATGSLAWAYGSLLGRDKHAGMPLVQVLAVQMTSAGILLLAAGTALGEWRGFDIARPPLVAWLALVYLMVFGSIVALGAYHWLLRRQSAPLVGTYAFVNPIVAIALGSLLLGEPLGPRLLFAALLVVVGVAAILWSRARNPPPAGLKAAPPPGSSAPYQAPPPRSR